MAASVWNIDTATTTSFMIRASLQLRLDLFATGLDFHAGWMFLQIRDGLMKIKQENSGIATCGTTVIAAGSSA
jgi:hypothetical protein